jgi:1,4-alpha-glucan branching enzyme
MAIGSFVLVLHGHLPYVLRHGVWPHGEDWLYEAAAETYLPMLSAIDECVFFNAVPHMTIGLTPVLLEQLAHEDFKKGFEHYLADRIARAKQDRRDFEQQDNGHMVYLADWWVEQFEKLQKQFAEINRDIPKAYAERAQKGLIQILTSCATHGYLPLLYEDASDPRAASRGVGRQSSHPRLQAVGHVAAGVRVPTGRGMAAADRLGRQGSSHRRGAPDRRRDDHPLLR